MVLWKETLKVRLFGLVKIPLIWYVRPRVVALDDDNITVVLPLTRRTKNHWGTMYFGALAIGADLASGLIAMNVIEAEKKAGGPAVTLLFKDIHGEFLRRPEGPVHFTCDQGAAIRTLVQKAAASGERENMPVKLTCTVPSKGPEEVARFTLTLSLKRKG